MTFGCNTSAMYIDLTTQADKDLGKFLDYCTYGHMIDNVILIVTGTLHERDVQVSILCLSALPQSSCHI